jgi:YidC/Oxa1 family membrane protein insertase
MPTSKKRNPVLQFLLTFAVVYLITSMIMQLLFPEQFAKNDREEPQQIILEAPSKKAPLGRNVQVQLRNLSGEELTLPNRCPDPPLIIERAVGEKLYQIEFEDPVSPCAPLTEVSAGETVMIDLSPWKYAAFGEEGMYRISLPGDHGGEQIETIIRITKPGIFVGAFRAFVSKPLLNGLILIASVIPNHSLGWSIIVLTLVVKLLLLIPSQHALESQKKMQAIQPRIEEIKRKHKDNQQKMTEETMALWKREKINPLQSCLPTLIQIPILLGLFFIIRDSGAIELARHLLYPPFQHLDWSFAPVFLGVLDLTWVPYEGMTWWHPVKALPTLMKGAPVPLALALMQFAQMKMMFALKATKPKERKPLADRMDAQTMMLYMLPFMIFFIAGSLPAAVSLYWGISTVFSIGQQLVINRKKA